MPRPLVLAALAFVCTVPCARADHAAIGSVRLPVTAAELAAAVGIHRVDPSTLPLDLVRVAFASPDNANPVETVARAKLTEVLSQRGSGDLIPLPLSPRTWREHILREQVRDDELAARIFARRSTALLYHGLLGIDLESLAWIERNPAFLRSLIANPAATAVFAVSIRIRGGAIETPGDDARSVWAAVVGADPAEPSAFVGRLLSADAGAVAAFYHAIARLDPPHQAFAIGRRGDARRVEGARALLAASRAPTADWNGSRPFVRPEIDLLSLLRAIAVDARGVPRPPASRALWAKVFGQGSGGDEPIDAVWLAREMFGAVAPNLRRRLDTFSFAQRALGDVPPSAGDLAFVLHEHPRVPMLMGVLETLGEREVAAYAAAARTAGAVEDDTVALTLFQASLTMVDRARRSSSLQDDEARALSRSLVRAGAQRDGRKAIAAWFADTLVPALRGAGDAANQADVEHVVLQALAGRVTAQPLVVRWEDADYVADVAPAELRRLTRIRRRQMEIPLDAALAQAQRGDAEPLAHSLAGLVYACAFSDADGAASNAGPIWRRHRFRGHVAGHGGPPGPWRLASELFAADGWSLAGSLLRLDVALAPLALRRLDTTEMPSASHLSASDRRTLATTIALIDPQKLTDADRDAIAASLARGRGRIAQLAAAPEGLERIGRDAGLSGWRQNAIAWLLANDPSRVPGSFTLLEQARLGGGPGADSWGASTLSLDGCLCLRQPAVAPWEDFTGRASSGQLATQLPDVMLRTAEVLSERKLPALLARDVAAYAMQDASDRARTAYFDDWLSLALAVRDLPDDRFVDYVAALTVSGPLTPRGAR